MISDAKIYRDIKFFNTGILPNIDQFDTQGKYVKACLETINSYYNKISLEIECWLKEKINEQTEDELSELKKIEKERDDKIDSIKKEYVERIDAQYKKINAKTVRLKEYFGELKLKSDSKRNHDLDEIKRSLRDMRNENKKTNLVLKIAKEGKP